MANRKIEKFLVIIIIIINPEAADIRTDSIVLSHTGRMRAAGIVGGTRVCDKTARVKGCSQGMIAMVSSQLMYSLGLLSQSHCVNSDTKSHTIHQLRYKIAFAITPCENLQLNSIQPISCDKNKKVYQ